MISVRLSGDTEKRLENLSDKTNRPKSHYIENALKDFLDEKEDYLLALARLEEKGPNISLEDAKKQLGFYDED